MPRFRVKYADIGLSNEHAEKFVRGKVQQKAYVALCRKRFLLEARRIRRFTEETFFQALLTGPFSALPDGTVAGGECFPRRNSHRLSPLKAMF
jgi:hypothetical protein